MASALSIGAASPRSRNWLLSFSLDPSGRTRRLLLAQEAGASLASFRKGLNSSKCSNTNTSSDTDNIHQRAKQIHHGRRFDECQGEDVKFLKRLLWAAIFLIAVRVVVAVMVPSSGEMSQQSLDGVVAEMNKAYPKDSSTGVRIERASSEKRTLTWHKTVLDEKTAADMRGISTAERTIRQNESKAEVCTSVELRKLFDAGFNVRNVYRDKAGVVLIDTTTRPSDCK